MTESHERLGQGQGDALEVLEVAEVLRQGGRGEGGRERWPGSRSFGPGLRELDCPAEHRGRVC